MPSWLTHWREVLNAAAALASIAGLFFSYFAWRKASGAETAANRAREAVQKSNAGEDLQRLSDKAQELLSCTQSDQIEAALLRSRDLLAGIAQVKQRWQAFLIEDSPEQIKRAATQVDRISRALSVGGAAMTPQIKEKLLKSCHEVAIVLAEEHGKALRRVER